MTGGPPHSKRCTAAWFSHLRGAATRRYTRVVVCPDSKNILPFPVAAALEFSCSRLACKLLIKCDLLIRANNSEIFHFPTPIVWVESPVEIKLAHESLFSGLVAPPPPSLLHIFNCGKRLRHLLRTRLGFMSCQLKYWEYGHLIKVFSRACRTKCSQILLKIT